MHAAATRVELKHDLQHGNRRSVLIEQLSVIRENLGEDVRREKCLVVIQTSSGSMIPNLRVPPLRAVVTRESTIINDISFEVWYRENNVHLNGDTDLDTVCQ